MPYEKQIWLNGAAGGTPVSAARLEHMEDGILELSENTAKKDLSDDETKDVLPGLLALARDQSNVDLTFPVQAWGAFIPGMTVSIPPVTRDVEISYHAYGKVTTVGVGIFGYTLFETTGGGAGVDFGGNDTELIDKNGLYEGLRAFHGSEVAHKLAVPAWRTFRLMGGVFIQSGGVGAAVSPASGAIQNRSAHIKAVLL